MMNVNQKIKKERKKPLNSLLTLTKFFVNDDLTGKTANIYGRTKQKVEKT